MANLTLVIDDDVLRRARIRALEQDTSVNALVRDYLDSFAGGDQRANAVATVLELAEESDAKGSDRRWTRDEIHER